MDLLDDMDCVYEPERFLAKTLPVLRSLAEPSQLRLADGGRISYLLAKESDYLSTCSVSLGHVSVQLHRLRLEAARADLDLAYELWADAHRRWLADLRSPQGRAALLAEVAGDWAGAEALCNSALWVACGRLAWGATAQLFVQAFTLDRWSARGVPSMHVMTVPEWFPSLDASRRVVEPVYWASAHRRYNSMSLVFPGVPEPVADTFAALWNPRDLDSVFSDPDAALAASMRLASRVLVP